VNVQNDLIMPKLQSGIAFQQHIVDEQIEQWHIQTPWFCLWTMNNGCSVS